jgi:bifunctional DNA-binding transcriptional regulator/antitoxin component of YhaV-PrlF toxin-antitoxin module
MKLRVNAKGQIRLPDELLEKYGIVAGTRIVCFDNGSSITLKPITEEYLKKLQGSLRGTGSLKGLIQEKRKRQQ